MITDNLSWTTHVDATVKEAQQCLFFLRQLSKFGMSIMSLTNFYRCTILSGCIMAWYGNCIAQYYKKPQIVVCTAQTIMEANLPSTDSISQQREEDEHFKTEPLRVSEHRGHGVEVCLNMGPGREMELEARELGSKSKGRAFKISFLKKKVPINHRMALAQETTTGHV
eukprot:g27959.t1